jgi:hypothetical protein
MILGCILLVLVLNRYGFSTKVSARESHAGSAVTLTAIAPTGIPVASRV